MSFKHKLLGTVLSVAAVFATGATALASTYNGTTVSSAADGKTYTVVANSGDTLTLNNAGQSGALLNITFKNNVSGTIVINPSTTLPASASSAPSGNVATYFDVTLSGLSNSDISGATWNFSATKSFLSNLGLTSSNVFLEHWNGSSWDRLSTKLVSSDSNNYNFAGTVTSFSPFAVVAVPGLTNTGVSYALIAALSVGAIVVVAAAFFLTRNKKQTNL